MKNRKMCNKKQTGFTMVELMIVVAIIAVLGVVVGQTVLSKIDENKVNDITTEFTQIAEAMAKCATLNNGVYTACDYTEIRRLGYLDDNWGDGTAQNPYGGNYTTQVVAGNVNRFTIVATSIPQEDYGQRLISMWDDSSVATPTFATGTFTVTQGTR